MRAFVPSVALLCVLSACSPVSRQAHPAAAASAAMPAEPPVPSDAWRAAADPADSAALDSLPQLWTSTLAALKRPARAQVSAEGPLLDPAAALDHPALPPGSYNCRVMRLEAGRVQSFPAQFCFVAGESDGRLSFNKQTGSDTPNGWLYDDEHGHYVFLGARQLRAGENSLSYRADRSRDVAGVIERVGMFRWRLVVPRTAPAGLWVYELTPVPTESQPN